MTLVVGLAATIGVLVTWRQKNTADRRSEWWRRTAWAFERSLSRNKLEAELGWKVLATLVASELAKTVLYSYALWIIGRIDFNVPVDELREVMARWFFMSQMTGRYTSSPETRMQEDLNRLDGLPAVAAEFVKILNAQIDAAVPDDWWGVTLPNNLNTSSAGAPAYVAYIAALNILDADVLLATSKIKEWINPNRRTLKGIEKHHLFPRDYLKTTLGLKTTRKSTRSQTLPW